MAKCGINTISIGKLKVPSGRVVQALESVKSVRNIDRAIAKSYEQMPEGTDFEAWNKWFRNFEKPAPTLPISAKDITKRETSGKRAENLGKLLNLSDYESSDDYQVGEYAKRLFGKVKNNLLAKGKGMTDDEIYALTKSLKAVLTKDRVRQDQRKLRTQARSNIKTKIGANTELGPAITKVLTVEPEMVPADKVDLYNKILEEFGQRTRVLTLQDAAQSFVDAQEFIQGLDQSLFEQKEKGAKVEVKPETLIKQIKGKVLDPSKIKNVDERNDIKLLQKLTDDDLKFASNDDLQVIVDSIDAINGGIFPPTLKETLINLGANKSVRDIQSTVEGVKPTTWRNIVSRAISGAKARIRGTNYAVESIRSSPLTVVDQFFGGKGQKIYDATFGKLSTAYAKYDLEAKGISLKLEVAETALEKKFKGNALAKAKFSIKIYQIQREYEANKGKPGIAPAMEWVQKTIDDAANIGFYTEESKALLQEIVDKHASDGEFDAEALGKSFSAEMNDAVTAIDDINTNLIDKLLYTSGTIRGKQATLYTLYTSHNILSDEAAKKDASGRMAEFVSPQSAKSKETEQRTTEVSAISMDPFYDASQSTKGLLLDYHMTPVVREVLRTTKRTIEAVKGGSKETMLGARALDATVKEVLENVFSGTNQPYSTADKFIQDVKRVGYYATLASAPRAVAELTSNVSFGLLAAPKQMALGATKYRSNAYDPEGALFLNNVGSVQTGKFYEGGIEGSKHVDPSNSTRGPKRAQGRGEIEDGVRNKMTSIKNGIGAGYVVKAFTKVSETLISAPDKIVNRTLWFGAFGDSFSKSTGKDPDMAKIKAGDQSYLEANAEAIAIARKNADHLSVMSGATNNPFSAITALQQKKGGDGAQNLWRTMSGYLQTFLLFEFTTAKTAVMGLVGEGHLTKRQGAGVIAGVAARMTLYGTVYKILSDSIAEALGFGDDEEEEDYGEMLKNDLIGSILTLFFGRNLTSFPKIPINYAIEAVNESVVGEDYDSFKDAKVWSLIGDRDFGYGKSFADFLVKLVGPYGAATKGGEQVWKEIAKYVNDKQDLGKTAGNSTFQVLGNAGLIPFFKDANKIFKAEQYKLSKNKKKKKKNIYKLEKLDLDLDLKLKLD